MIKLYDVLAGLQATRFKRFLRVEPGMKRMKRMGNNQLFSSRDNQEARKDVIAKRIVFILLGLICVFACRQACVAQSDAQCLPGDGQNGSKLCVTFGFRDGKLVVNRGLSKLNESSQFTKRLSHDLTSKQVETLFFDQLDQMLSDRKKPYQLALTTGEQAKDAAGQLNDPLTSELRGFSGSFLEYQQKFTAWVNAVPGRQSFGTIFGGDFGLTNPDGPYFPLNSISNVTALIFSDDGNTLSTSTFRFTVVDPVNDWSDASQVNIVLPGVNDSPRKTARLNRIREKLAPLSGQIWNPSAIKTTITRYYRQLDLVPVVTVSGVDNGLSITIIEAQRVARIILPPQDDKDSAAYNADIDKILYVLISDKDFRTFIKRRDSIIPAIPVDTQPVDTQDAANRPVVDYAANLDHDGPYLDASRIQVQQLLLAQIGYIASVQDAEGSTLTGLNVVLDVQKIADTKETPPGTAKTAPPTANAGDVVTGHQQEAKPNTDFVPQNAPKTEESGKPLKEKKNYIGGGFEYRPGQGIRFFGLGQRSQLKFPFRNGNISATGGGNGSGIGSVNYFADYIGFGRLHRRVSLQLSGGSDSDPNRMLAGHEMDERRDSGMVRIEFEPFRDKGGSLLRFSLEGRQTMVALRENDVMKAKQHLTTLDAGGLFTFESVESEHPRRVRLEPRMRFGLGLADGAPSFTKLTLTGNFHQSLPRRLAADISGNLGLASRNTPMFELLSFGGAEIVRGFRRDDALGRRLWSLQNELWLPLPHTATDDENGFKAFLRDNVRLAPFADVGGLYRPITSKAGVRSGYGLGLRIIYSVIILKVDYAYGVGTAATGGSRGKFYFSISSNLPF